MLAFVRTTMWSKARAITLHGFKVSYQYDFGLVQVHLQLGQSVGLFRVLVFGQVAVQFIVVGRPSSRERVDKSSLGAESGKELLLTLQLGWPTFDSELFC